MVGQVAPGGEEASLDRPYFSLTNRTGPSRPESGNGHSDASKGL